MPITLELSEVTFRYRGIGASDRAVLDRISMRFSGAGCTAIVGPSGSGKTTLIQQFTGLLRPESGRVLVDGQDIWQRRYDQNRLRRRIGLVFQFPETQLFEETVQEDVAFAPRSQGLPPEGVQQRVESSLTAVGLDAGAFAPRSPFQLSEGEKRRVAIAGVLAMAPELLVLDEPTAGLDAVGIDEIADIIERLCRGGTGVIVITHNMDFVNDVADRVVVMSQGAIRFDGAPQILFADWTLMRQNDLTLPHFLRLKQQQGREWPDEWRNIATLRQFKKIVMRPATLRD